MGLKQIWSLILLVAIVGSRLTIVAAAEFAGGSRATHDDGHEDDGHHLKQQTWNRRSNPEKSYYPAIFTFGDSLSDPGNNNHLLTLAKANRLPYGRDSPDHMPSGRFSNGLIGPDFIADFIGLPSPPPYLSAGDNILQGVSFASSSSGILNSSGSIFGQHLPLAQQVTYFAKVKAALQVRLGRQGTDRLLRKSLFYLNFGSNDYIINYLLTGTRSIPSPLERQYTPPQFEDLLLSNLALRIEELYAMGARKLAIVGLSLLGCVPYLLLIQGSRTGECIDSINKLARTYNAALLNRVRTLQAAHRDARFTYLDTYGLVASIVKQPSAYGFENVSWACCGLGRFNALLTCSSPGVYRVCEDASKYVFWDSVHPTASVNKLVAIKFWTGSYPDTIPYNLRELALAS